jgi:ParB-like chromosome segregation protein Spo0J
VASKSRSKTTLKPKGSRPRVEHIDEIVLNNARVQIRGMDIPLSKVHLDPLNPRLANTVSLNYREDDEKLQAQLETILWDDRDVKDLYQSIKKNGGLIERIIVRPSGVVAEGNCRTVVYRKLHAQFPDDPAWKSIPARVLPDDIDEKQIAILLGELHVGGKNEWIPFEKAGHIHELFHTHGLTQDEIAKLLHTSKTAINHNIHAFAAMKERYIPEYPGPAAVRRFSYFLELYKKPFLREWVKDSPTALDKFVKWVGTEKVGKGAEVRHLDAIIQNPAALKAFDSGGIEAARAILMRDRPELTSPLFKGMIELAKTIEDARLDDIARVRNEKSGGARTIVQDLKDALDKFMDLCGGF